MNNQIKQTIKQMQEIADKNGFYLMPKEFYKQMFNLIEVLKRDIKRARDKRDSLKLELKELKK
ncbi:MAG: hypothetical protein ACTSXY_12465 [Promethearchaeota archaeon]